MVLQGITIVALIIVSVILYRQSETQTMIYDQGVELHKKQELHELKIVDLHERLGALKYRYEIHLQGGLHGWQGFVKLRRKRAQLADEIIRSRASFST